MNTQMKISSGAPQVPVPKTASEAKVSGPPDAELPVWATLVVEARGSVVRGSFQIDTGEVGSRAVEAAVDALAVGFREGGRKIADAMRATMPGRVLSAIGRRLP